MATLELASWVTNLTYSNLTPSVVEAAVKSTYNWAGCAIGGYAQDAPHIAQATTQAFFGGPPTSSILGSNGSISEAYADAQLAALLNGIASHIDDYDDTHLETIIHPAGPVASALLAVAEWQGPVTGRDFLTAFVAGVEAECKLGLSVTPEHYDVGWHITSTTGSIGAAVAVGKLLDLDVTQMQNAVNHFALLFGIDGHHAPGHSERRTLYDPGPNIHDSQIGIAATQVVGMQEFFGSMTKSFHVGRAAQGGMLGALLAKNNYTSSLHGLEAQYGWLHVVSTRENATAYFDQLGKIWEIEKNTFKPFPCGIVLHPTIDAAIQLHNEAIQEGKNISSVKKINLQVNSEVLVLTGKTDPTTGLEGKFSVYHAAAVAFLYGKATPTQFTDDVVKNATIIEYRKKVNVTTDDAQFSTDQATVTIEFGDGSTLQKHIEHALGSLENPLTDAQLKTKFMDQVSKQLGEQRAERAYAAFTNIGNLTDVGTLRMLY
ncbi:2-methylcitrate dehydratase PrpD [Xylariaceae sp. FL1651]|nr:2-methylcitrate dehydratase PrpD [Xylariaceae sp. FL1651]